jgi:hypothetical protein
VTEEYVVLRDLTKTPRTEEDRVNIEITANELTDLVGDVNFDLRLDYSGRAMYGRECLGLVGGVDDYGRFIAEIAQEVGRCDETNDDDETIVRTDHLREILLRVTSGVRTDAMGHDTIFYFPTIRVVSSP